METGSGGWEAGAAVGERPSADRQQNPHAHTISVVSRGAFSVVVTGETLREALIAIGVRGGWTQQEDLDHEVFVVTDVPWALADAQVATRTVLVVEPTPAAARAGVQMFAAGTVTALFAADRPSDLLEAFDMVEAGWTALPVRLMELASRMPELSERQLAVIQAVQAGLGNREIGRDLCLSPASVKRELAALYRTLGIDNRMALSTLGAELGLSAQRPRSMRCARPSAREGRSS